ncbi:hypothetical protein M758_5G086600 [Ceratodon purpureus]|nr:hypothetical protein M758_5G086600 [Ceratodon purpureus]
MGRSAGIQVGGILKQRRLFGHGDVNVFFAESALNFSSCRG